LTERWITDSSPLIALAAVGKAHLLTEIPDELIVPEGVALEVLAGPPEDAGRRLLESELGRRSSPSVIPSRLLAWGLGRGETDALALRLEMGAGTVVLDDLAARKCATALGVPSPTHSTFPA
jgi:predicted nucleic acid-binding protein